MQASLNVLPPKPYRELRAEVLGLVSSDTCDLWKERLKNCDNFELILEYCGIKGERWPEAEPFLMQSPMCAFYYAVEVIGGRWPEAEPFLMQSPIWALYYAVEVIGGRWPEAEPFLEKRSAVWAKYSKDIKERKNNREL